MQSLTLRPATEHEVDTLLEMMNDFNRSESISWEPVNTARALRRLLGEPPLGQGVILERAGFEEPPRIFLTKRLPGAR